MYIDHFNLVNMANNIFKLFLHSTDEQSSWSEEGDKAKDIMYEGEVRWGPEWVRQTNTSRG